MRSQKKLKRWILTFDNLGTVSFEQKWQEWSGLELLITDWRLSQSSLSSVGSTSKCQLLHQSGTFNKKMYKKLWCGWEVKLFELRFVCYVVTAATAAKSLQSCPTLCNPIHGSPPGSPIPGNSPGKSTGVWCHCLLWSSLIVSSYFPCNR